ncbi:ZIP family metal transporter [Myroides sp. 1354]|uniref:ZIP family metal transporter n=1 Tax=unclassified Myroides TaxID=2642485 RepID=UPI002578C211|nr:MULTISPECIES: ZIP family metal transporter [unclassified Myroides]MDM1045811.1 ZIP family metal transporter [Myroides sp. R163-1]MDM1055734.1 ZIP family metal transporter [Myroides sp. 1354]MDM1069826.1 ZIP family metal transporter [Myroides sp. 1372]
MAYIVPLLAVIIGYLIALLLQPKNKKHLKLLMAFSGSFLLTLTVTHLLPDVYQAAMGDLVTGGGHLHDHDHDHGGAARIGFFIMAGIVFQIILEYFSKGAEHGHVHGHEKLDRIPWLLFISLCIHALFEGMPISQHSELALGIGIHHLPIAIILTAFFINAQMNKKMVFVFMMLFSIMTPLGTLISSNVPILNTYYAEISAIVVGILFHISSTIIFESNEDHKFNINKLIAILLGVIAAYFI